MKKVRPLLASALPAAAAVSVVNTIWVFTLPQPFLILSRNILIFGLCNAGFFLLLGLALACVEGGLAAFAKRAASGLFTAPAPCGRRKRICYAVLLAAAGGLAFLALAQAAVRILLKTLHAPEIISFASAAAVACVLAGIAVAGIALFRLGCRSPSGITCGAVPAAAIAAVSWAAAALWRLNGDWITIVVSAHLLDFILILALQCALLAALGGRFRMSFPAVSALVAAILAWAGLALAAMGRDMDIRYLFLNRRGAGKIVYSALSRVTDRDGDGFSRLLGNRDCDDRNSSVHPGGSDIPRNGIDENCLLGDFRGWVPQARVACPHYARPADGKPRKIVFISIEAFRGDMMYGEKERRCVPRLEEFASRNVQFRRAYATGPITGFTVVSVFRSKYLHNLFYSAARDPGWAAKVPSLADVLRKNGCRTIALVPDAFVSPGEATYSVRGGFDEQAYPPLARGVEYNTSISSPELTAMGIDILKRHSDHDVFLWMHYYDPHRSYLEHPGFTKGKSEFDRYKGELSFTDHYIGQMLAFLERTFSADRLTIVIFGDHGEAFGEHGQRFHGFTIFDEETRVACAMKFPSVRAQAVEAPVSLIDISPTVLDSLGLEIPAQWQGQSLLPLVVSGNQSEWKRKVYFDFVPFKGMIAWPYKIMWDIRSNWVALYNLASDPGERTNLYSRGDPLSADMKSRLDEWMEQDLNPWL